MQTIKTEHGTYKISDTRDAAKFMAQIAKPKNPRKRPEPAPLRGFPGFEAGTTTTKEYLKAYFEINNFDRSYLALLQALHDTPAPCYDPTQPLVEVHHE